MSTKKNEEQYLINAVSKMVLAKRSMKPVSQLLKIHPANLKKTYLTSWVILLT